MKSTYSTLEKKRKWYLKTRKCAKIKKICLHCDKEFLVYPYRKDTAKYCSISCSSSSKTGKNAKNWRGGKVLKTCEWCGKEFTTHKCNIKIGWGKYCSKKCDNLSRSEKNRGKSNFNWRGGTTPMLKLARMSKRIKEWRNFVFKRDDYTCQICEKRGGILNANHIKKFADYPELRTNINNGITLCKKCHFGMVNKHEEEWESYFNFNLSTRGGAK